MTAPGDLLAIVLARELVTAARAGLRVLALTSPVSLVAGLAARRLGAPELAIATGFGILDAVDPVPALTLGEGALGTAGAVRGPAADTFAALARGRVGVAVTPAQLDARGATNLSRVGGSDDHPGVALPGSRGLPDNNDAPSRLWYLFATHSPRQLVAEVDFVSGPPPAPGRYRRVITPLGVFALASGSWQAVTLTEGVRAADVAERTGFPVAVADAVPVTPAPDEAERAALDAVDPHGLRHLEHLDRDAAAALQERVAAVEGAG